MKIPSILAFAILLAPGAPALAQIVPTPTWTDFYSSGTTLNGHAFPTGYVIEAFDPQGTKCGAFTVVVAGTYGYLHVYGDDVTTPEVDEGASTNDTILFRVAGHRAVPSVAPVWISGTPGALLEVNLAFANSPPHFTSSLHDTVISENQLLTFQFTGHDSDGDQVTMTYLSGPPGASFANGTFSWIPDYSQAGVYSVIVSIRDTFETVRDTAVITVLNVNRVPSLTATADKSVDEGSTLSFSLYGSDPDGNLITFSSSNLPSGAVLNASTGSFSWMPTFFQAGTYSVIFTATDDGTPALSAFDTVVITVHNVNRLPQFVRTLPDTTIAETKGLSYTYTAVDLDGDALTFSLSSGPSGSSMSSSGTLTWTPTPIQSGTYEIIISLTDGAAIAVDTAVVVVTNVNRAPILIATADKTVDEGSTLSFTLSGSDPDGNLVTFSSPNLPQGATLNASSGAFSWTPTFFQAGSYNIIFIVTDDGSPVLFSSDTVVVTVANVNQVPHFVGVLPDTIVAENQPLSYIYTAVDPDSTTLTYALVSGPSGSSVSSTGLFAWMPDYSQAGIHTVVVSLTDGEALLRDTASITVTNTNRPPMFIRTLPDTTIAENQTLSYTYSGTDPDSTALTFALVSGPTGSNMSSSGTLTWTPTSTQSGTYKIIVSLTDGAVTVLDTASVAVTNVNRAPVLTATPDKSVDEGSTLSFTLSGIDPDGNLIIFSSPGLPSGATLNASTGAFNWTPTFLQAGVYAVIFTATDDGTPALSASDTVVITVINVNRAPGVPRLGKPSNQDTIKLVTAPQPLRFLWSRSVDQDPEDTVKYSLAIKGPSLDTTMSGIRDTSQLLDLIPKLVPASVYRWSVTATDGKVVVSSPDTFTFRTSNTVTGVDEAAQGIPKTLTLRQNYPNPFNPSTTLEFISPKSGRATVKVYNGIGQIVSSLFEGEIEAGRVYRLIFEAEHLPSGLYFARLQFEGTHQTTKMVLVR